MDWAHEWMSSGRIIGPSMFIDFKEDQLDPRITFTRASSGTYWDADGVLQTASTDVARLTHDPATGESLGLLIEPQATNILLNSSAPATQSVTVSNATVYTLACYGSGSLEVTAGGSGTATNGSPLTFTTSATTVTVTVTGSPDYFQLELGSVATSPIPTVASQVTRAADVAVMTGTNFSDWYNASEGTFVVDYTAYISGQSVVVAQNAAVTSYMEIAWRAAGDTLPLANVVDGGVNQASLSAMSSARNVIALAYKGNDFAMSANGSAVATDGSGTVPSVDRLQIYAPSIVKSLSFYRAAFSAATLQSLTGA